jgi:kynurenine 3-monooxygenase
MDYSQTYIDTLWCEFNIPPADEARKHTSSKTSASATDNFATSPNHLHIWPSDDKMFIAIPSTDKTFTCTLFAPAATFDYLQTHPDEASILAFFQHHFPGVSPNLIAPSDLHAQFTTNPHLPLISLKCSPHVYAQGGGVILGDAAHAMLPFYGQGMNAGLEDVRVLFEHLDAEALPERNSTRQAHMQTALTAYSASRVPDAHTINDLASANFWEMHAGVRSPLYLARKRVEEFLSDKAPWTGFATQYARVSFSNERYSEVARNVQRQGEVLLRGFVGAALLPVVSWAAWWVWRYNRASGTGRVALKGGVGVGAWLSGLGERVGRVFT